MKLPKSKKTAHKLLSKPGDSPIAEVRVMQVNSATVVPFFPVVIGGTNNASTTSTPPQIDHALLHVTAENFTNLVKAAKAYPEVRNDVVSAYKSQLANGSYPSDQTIAGLASRLTGSDE